MKATAPTDAQPSPAPGSLLIVEEALHTLKGHWFEYIQSIRDACRDRGDSVSVIAHREADPIILKDLNALPILPRSAWDRRQDHPNPILRYLGVFRHNWSLFRAVDAYLRDSRKNDTILAPTILIHHLIAWSILATKYRKSKYNRLVLFFVNGQGVYQGPHTAPRFPRNPKTAMFRFFLRRLRPLVETGEVILAAETEGMAREYQNFCGLPFRLLPHPVRFPEVKPRRPSLDESGHRLTFSCFGFARHEKGSDLLQNAILAIRQKHPDRDIRFVVQWVDDFPMPDGTPVTRDPFLLNDPAVTFVTQAVDGARYRQYLAETDAMILPYRVNSYYARVSRVAIEAAISGIPLVYTQGTWMEEMAREFAAGIGFQNEDVDSLVDAILRMADQITSFQASAEERRHAARKQYSPDQFRTRLLANPAPSLLRGEANRARSNDSLLNPAIHRS